MTPKGLLTTTVGSFPKPEYLVRARNQHAAGRLGAEELHALERKATEEVIRLQEDIGLDILVDGEMARGDMVAYFAEQLEGMEIGGLVRSYGNRYYHKPIIKEKVRWVRPMTLEMWQFAQQLTDKPVKGMLTGPYTMVEWSFIEGYDTRRDAVLAMAEAIHREARVLDDAGAQYIQIDEPALSTRLEDLDLAIEAMGIVTDGLKAHTITHICYGDFASVYPRFFDMPVRQFDLEMANSGYDLVELFKRGIPNEKEIAWGVIDVHSHLIEREDDVVRGIRLGLEVLPPHRLYIDPDCGLKTRTPEEAEQKLRVMMKAVHRVRRELG
ncbi:MAG TPA: methionine synthase, partial [Dehalococcoidia bacterium]|nr:methionine synthase [Dehalococcoidia bacterium]